MAEVRKVEAPKEMTLEEVARLALQDDSAVQVPVVKPEKLLNKKYYRTVNIEVSKEELAAVKKAQKAKKDDSAAAAAADPEAYKVILRGMGFNV